MNSHSSYRGHQRVRSKYDAVVRPARTKARLLLRAVEDGYVRLDDL
ncbi:hypothetical protein [Dietzia lutea]|nr:hypothetical protein [Dietzia lutea]